MKETCEIEAPGTGVISAHEVYTLDEAKRRMKVGEQAWRTSRQQGLPVRTVGRRKFVLGGDILNWIASMPFDVATAPSLN